MASISEYTVWPVHRHKRYTESGMKLPEMPILADGFYKVGSSASLSFCADDVGGESMFESILFASGTASHPAPAEEPDFFHDLNLDQLVDRLARDHEHLRAIWYAPLDSVAAIHHRHEVMRDLQCDAVFHSIDTFGRGMKAVHASLTQVDAMYYRRQQQSWQLDAVKTYLRTVESLAVELSQVTLTSQGLKDLRGYLVEYVGSERFRTMVAETKEVSGLLDALVYNVVINGTTVVVREPDDEVDYREAVEGVFARFRRRPSKDFRVTFSQPVAMNHVEAQILEGVVRLYPEPFAALAAYDRRYRGRFMDEPVMRFDREIQFYTTYRELMSREARLGVPFCYPDIAVDDKAIFAADACDVMLAEKLAHAGKPPVPNDFHLEGAERILVVSGPNQGGKTTFARMVGQLHHLARLGLPVPARQARLYLCDHILTHFEREEDTAALRGKLGDDLERLRGIMSRAGPRSLVLLNEIFASTALKDATYLGRKILEQIMERDMLAVIVTFIEEWATFSSATVSMVSAVDPEDPTVRTFKIVRRPPDGRSYAMTLAEKYGLTYDLVCRRFVP